MSWLSGVLGIKDIVLGVMDRIKLSPEKKAEIEIAMAQNAHEIAKMEIEIESKVLETAAKNIQAEASSDDRFVSRARPTFLYIIYCVLCFNYIALPIIQLFKGMPNLVPIELPEDLYWLFGAGYLGYTGFRSLDKGGFKWNRQR